MTLSKKDIEFLMNHMKFTKDGKVLNAAEVLNLIRQKAQEAE